jgi:hypothetical protein
MINDPCPLRRRTDLVYHIRKNVPTGALPSWARQCCDCVNSDSVTIKGEPCDPETLLFQYGGTGDDQRINGKNFCEISFDLIWRADNWREAIPNRDFFQLIDPKRVMTQALPGDQIIGSGKNKLIRRRIYVAEGDNGQGVRVPCTEAQMIDKNGKFIERPDASNIIILTPLIPVKVPFSNLPLK